MLNKPADVDYCGVNKDRIAKANPVLDPKILEYHYEWMRDRYIVHIRKDVLNNPAPWTENPILQQVKFCNVRREHDRQSLNLINNITSNPHLSIEDKMFNCVLFRMYNLWGPIEALGGPFTIQDFQDIDLDACRQILKVYEGDGNPIFTNAFNTGGLKQCLAFPEMVVNHKEQRFGGMMVTVVDTQQDPNVFSMDVGQMDYKEAKKLAESDPERYSIVGWEPYMPMRIIRALKAFVTKHPDYFKKLLDAPLPDLVYSQMYNDIEGLGPFLAYQIWVDFTYIKEYPFSENCFTISGPGCRAGIDLLFKDRDGMTYDECIFWIRDNQDVIYSQMGYDRDLFWMNEDSHDRCMNVMQLENSFCELSKYTRCKTALEQGQKPRGKVSYNGGATPAKPVQGNVRTSKSLFDLLRK